MTAPDRTVVAVWAAACATLVVVAVVTGSTYAWLACGVAAAATAVILLGIAQAPAQTIAEILRDAEQH